MSDRRCWLMKSEPDAFSFDDLMSRPGRREPWDGVRNYQARNLMRDEMRVGDEVLFYHSRCTPPHVAGIARIAGPARPDPTQFEPSSKYYDAGSKADDPRWVLVVVEGVRPLERPVSLDELKASPHLEGMLVIRKGQRLSIQPVDPAHYDAVLAMAQTP